MKNNLQTTLLFWPKTYISGTDFHYLLKGSDDSRHGIIKRTIQKNYLIPLRRDLYLINRPNNVSDAFEIAPLIYGPSYVSFESALSYHGWIPEAVRTTTCATVKRSKDFETPIGRFSYEHIPIKAFSFGIEQHQQNEITLFIASPVKALADFVFVRKPNWDSVEDLYEDLRIEQESIKEVDKRLFSELIDNYPSARVKRTLRLLLKGLHQ